MQPQSIMLHTRAYTALYRLCVPDLLSHFLSVIYFSPNFHLVTFCTIDSIPAHTFTHTQLAHFTPYAHTSGFQTQTLYIGYSVCVCVHVCACVCSSIAIVP